MLFGIHVFPTEHSIQPDELARAAEERGLESIWFSEHTHILFAIYRRLNKEGNPYPISIGKRMIRLSL